jgi:hypothetical protein
MINVNWRASNFPEGEGCLRRFGFVDLDFPVVEPCFYKFEVFLKLCRSRGGLSFVVKIAVSSANVPIVVFVVVGRSDV